MLLVIGLVGMAVSYITAMVVVGMIILDEIKEVYK
mgnify:CR=1 FL=1